MSQSCHADDTHAPAAGAEVPPMASMLMQSLRSVGYTAAAALADLIDNSIAAQATCVHISMATHPRSFVALVDDGTGMDEDALISAMRYGSRDPRDQRHGTDLGRFGLGLKTASLSQCCRLTVATLKDGLLRIARWDLEECDRRGTWWLERPSPSELPSEPLATLRRNRHGTAVIWETLDRLATAGGETAILDAADHLALVFHRFLGSDGPQTLQIFLNNRPLEQIDPFLEGHVRGQALHAETIPLDGHFIKVSPFVLPFPSRLKQGDLERAGGRESLRTGHGFYIYRGGRLVVRGGWFRIVPSDDLIRLARVRIDVPVELDHLWKIDIRKAIAEPPPLLRPHLKRIVGGVVMRSRKVYTHKGLPADEAERVPLWRRQDLRDGAAAWQINRDHPAIKSFLSASPQAGLPQSLLKLLEDNLPVHDIHIHTANDQPIAEQPTPVEGDLQTEAARLMAAFSDQPAVRAGILDRLHLTEPFNRNPEAARRIVERLRG